MARSYFEVWRRNILILILFLVAGFALTWFKVSKEKGSFKASASVWLKTVNYEKTTVREALSFLNPQILGGAEVNTQCALIKSNLVLKDVVKELGLDSGNQEALNRNINFLKSSLTVEPVRGTKIIEVTAQSDKPGMAIKIANAVARAYITFVYREEENSYDEIYKLQDEQVKLAKEKLTQSDELATRSVNEKVYLMMLEMREDTRLNKALTTREIQLLEPAIEEVFRGTRKRLKLFVGTLMGLLLGAGAILMKEYLATPLWPDRPR